MHKDILYVLNNLRKEDEVELLFHFGKNWKTKTFKRLIKSKVTILKNSNGLPFAMGGIDGKSSIACVWLLTTDEVVNNKIKLFNEIKKQLNMYQSKYLIYFNYIFKSNKLAKKWLVKFGFRFDNPYPKNLKLREGFEFFYRLNQ